MDEKKGNLKKMLSWSDSSDSDSDEENGIKKGTSIVWVCNSYSCQIIHSLTNSYTTLVCKTYVRIESYKKRRTTLLDKAYI